MANTAAAVFAHLGAAYWNVFTFHEHIVTNSYPLAQPADTPSTFKETMIQTSSHMQFFSLSLKMKRLWWLKKKSRELTQWMNTVWWAIKTISTFVCLPLADACCAMPQQFVLEPRVFACCFLFRARIGIRKQQSWGASWFSFTACLFNLLGYYVRYGKNKARNRL